MIPSAVQTDAPRHIPADRTDSLARWALFAVLAGMLALPMVPGWQGLTRLLAIYVLYHTLVAQRAYGTARWVLAALGAGLAVVAASWVQSAVQSPGRHAIGTLTDVFGLALPLYGGIALTLVDLLLLAGLSAAAMARVRHRLAHAGIVLALAVWLFSLGGPIVRGLNGSADVAQVAQMLAGSAEWAFWALFFVLCVTLVRQTRQAVALLVAVAVAGVMMAAVMGLQLALADYAYVLDAAHLEDYFYRVRGTAYYHAPATYTVAIALLVLLGLLHAGRSGAWLRRLALAALIVILTVIIGLNNTRGLNLALVGGAGLFAALMLFHRDWLALVLSLVVLGFVGSNMIYMKPAIGGAVPQADVSYPLLSKLGKPFGQTVDTYHAPGGADVGTAAGEPPRAPVIDGSLRLVLMKSGLHSLKDHLFVGTGIGTLDLVISSGEGYVQSSTYSSHTLYIDMALMAGVPAAAMFLAMCGLAFLSGSFATFRDWRGGRDGILPGLLGALVVLGVGAVFLPQEMNNIVALFFIFSALLVILTVAPAAPGEAQAMGAGVLTSKAGLGVTALLGLGVLGWAFLTSPTYTLPILNLVARHAAEIERDRATVYVTAPLAVPLADAMLRLRGVSDPDVRLLPDSPGRLPEDNAFIIWHPATDWRYPVLKARLPYRFIRPNSTAPSVEFPLSWWMLKSVPYAGFLMQAGGRDARDVFADAENADTLPEGIELLPDVGRFIGIVTAHLPRPRAETDGMAEDAPPPVTTVTFSIARDLTDSNPATGRSWQAAKRETIYFDFGVIARKPVGAYRLIPSTVTTALREERMAWRLLGSDDLRDWHLLDSRSVTLGSEPEKAPAFAISNPRFYRYLVIIFEGQPDLAGNSLLGDIEFFPSPMIPPKAQE